MTDAVPQNETQAPTDVLPDGRVARCQCLVSQPYRDARFSAGLVTGVEPDTVYLRLDKVGREPTIILMRPDEMQSIVWVCSGTLWSVIFRDYDSSRDEDPTRDESGRVETW